MEPSSKLSFLTPRAMLAFAKFRQVFIEIQILHPFDLKSHIQVKINALGYAIREVVSLLTLDNLSQWYLEAFFSRKMILTKIWYETNNGKFLAIIKVFKTWYHYLKDCQYEILILTDHNNLCRFIDTRKLSFRQVC